MFWSRVATGRLIKSWAARKWPAGAVRSYPFRSGTNVPPLRSSPASANPDSSSFLKEASMSARPRFVRDTWGLIKPYWSSEERYSAWLLLAAVIGLTLAMVFMNVQFNSWYNDFYNALQEKNKEEFFRLMIRFAILAAIYITMAVYAFYLNQMLQIRWRRWMTDVYLKRWLAERTYYRMQLTGSPADNPDQRI